MRKRSVIAASALIFGVVACPSAQAALTSPAESPGSSQSPERAQRVQAKAGGPTAEQLLAKVRDCGNQVSNGEYATDDGQSANIPVCGKTGAVYWKADLDVVCDGQETEECNSSTDPDFQPGTAWQQSDGQPLNAAKLPFAVVPLPSDVWDPQDSGIEDGVGNVVAVIYQNKLVYGVVGDKGPENIIGEGSYALAEALGADPDPSSGGIDESDVTYIVFPAEKVDPIEDNAEANAVGERLASQFVEANQNQN
ncbi:MAG: hypothetical protein GEU98_06940 [Pseudonocardiaceae bacterium]|nr:hypothetical protein [Pseudonocardiaceae bacterium]